MRSMTCASTARSGVKVAASAASLAALAAVHLATAAFSLSVRGRGTASASSVISLINAWEFVAGENTKRKTGGPLSDHKLCRACLVVETGPRDKGRGDEAVGVNEAGFGHRQVQLFGQLALARWL